MTRLPFSVNRMRRLLPAYMVPTQVELRAGPLPRNANGKIDRRTPIALQRPRAILAATPRASSDALSAN